MKFLNKKEEVLSIQLTEHGRFLLSKGKFKPHFYAFFDDGVVYDSRFGGFEEHSVLAHERIKEELQLEAQSSFSSAEEKKNVKEYIRNAEEELELRLDSLQNNFYGTSNHVRIQNTAERHYSLNYPLGTMSPDSKNIPSWNVNVLQGEVSSSLNFKLGSHTGVRIPQLEMRPISFFVDYDANEVTAEGGIASGVTIEEDAILLDIREINTLFDNENFDIEVYEVENSEKAFNITGSSGKSNVESLIPLYFSRPPQRIVNGILLDESQIDQSTSTIDPSYVEYYFQILSDEEIESEALDNFKNLQDVSQQVFANNIYEDQSSGDRRIVDFNRIYESSTTREDTEDDC